MPYRMIARFVALAIAIALAAACVFYLITRLEWSEPLKVLGSVDLVALSSAILCLHFAYIGVRTLRWQLIVRDQNRDAPFVGLYWITAIVVSLAILTPGQIGESAKVELLKRSGFGSRLPGLGAFALERVLDILVLAGFGLVGLAFGSGFSARFPQLPAVAAMLFVLGLGVLHWLGRSRPSASPQGWLSLLRSGTGTSLIKAKMLVLTVVSWCLVGLAWQISLRMVGIDVSLAAVCWLLSLVTFAALISLMPGGIGLSDVLTIQALTGMGAAPAAAQAGALILRLYSLIVIVFGCGHLMAWLFIRRPSEVKSVSARTKASRGADHG
jgi:uncharacterized membrane protein YbhN (UPF0104 family)